MNFLSDQKHEKKHDLRRSFKKDSKLPCKIIPTLFETKLNSVSFGDKDLNYIQNLLNLEGKGMNFKCLLSQLHSYLVRFK